jgi:LmbE family N-acetylglucosaminyl deacetylase
VLASVVEDWRDDPDHDRSINSSVGRVKNVNLYISEDELGSQRYRALASRRYGPPVHRVVRLRGAALLTAMAMLVLRPASLRPQVRAEYDVGALGLLQSLQRLQTTASVLHTGAHPDDEDSALMARLARGDHARVVYLSLNRGEGGQNTIGPELFEPLGVIRTEELLQARRLDGGQQLFTRAFDFGFSKTRAESAAFWGEEAILDDMVRAIRTVRPFVVISRFGGTPADGHGHHQLAGYLTPIAVARAADPSSFPDQLSEGLRPWRALKLYVSEGFGASADAVPRLRLDTGFVDPVFGRSYFEIAMEGRSQHRSQHQGALELRGERSTGIRLVETTVNAAPADGLFAGIDTSVAGLAQLCGAPRGTLGAELLAIQSAAGRALAVFNPLSPADLVPVLAEGLNALRAAQVTNARLSLDPVAKAEMAFRLTMKSADFEEALSRARGLVVDPRADAETVAPGGTLLVSVPTFFPSGAPIDVMSVRLHAPRDWTVEPAPAPDPRAGGGQGRFAVEVPRHAAYFRVAVPPTAKPTEPYWLTEPRLGALFAWPTGSPKGEPFDAPPLEADVDVNLAGVSMTIRQPVEFRSVDPARGELRRRIDVVPAVSVAVSEPLVVVPRASRVTAREVVVRVENLASTPAEGLLTLHAPAGWTVRPRESPFSTLQAGERETARFVVGIPASAPAGEYRLEAAATVGDRRYTATLRTIAYPHIQTHRLYVPAVSTVRVMNLAVPHVRVGYIMGTGDDVAAAIGRMGLSPAMLDAETLTSGDLSRFDVIVVGIRASETRPDFVANHRRLLRWVETGGVLIVQYQQPDYVDRHLPPFPAHVGARVTDESAPVTILAPDFPAFTTPNRIVADDWSGWVQERSVNNWSMFDARYSPLLEAHDPGEAPQQGGEVVARIGQGLYVYTAYAWFRQLPAGVPGAFRLFANLLALGQHHRQVPGTDPGRAR